MDLTAPPKAPQYKDSLSCTTALIHVISESERKVGPWNAPHGSKDWGTFTVTINKLAPFTTNKISQDTLKEKAFGIVKASVELFKRRGDSNDDDKDVDTELFQSLSIAEICKCVHLTKNKFGEGVGVMPLVDGFQVSPESVSRELFDLLIQIGSQHCRPQRLVSVSLTIYFPHLLCQPLLYLYSYFYIQIFVKTNRFLEHSILIRMTQRTSQESKQRKKPKKPNAKKISKGPKELN